MIFQNIANYEEFKDAQISKYPFFHRSRTCFDLEGEPHKSKFRLEF